MTEISDLAVTQVLDSEDIYFVKEREESNIKSRLQAETQRVIGGIESRERGRLYILAECRRRPININSVLEGFRVTILTVIQVALR